MAKVLRSAGKYVSPKAFEKRRKLLAVLLSCVAICFGVAGYLIGQLLRKSPLWMLALAFLALVLLLRFIFLLARRKIEGLEEERDLSGGAEAHKRISETLEELPGDFRVIHDLTTLFGAVDHVVIGPTGVFVISTKNWKGLVSGDGNGELLWNRYPLDEPEVRNFAEMVGKIRENVKLLTNRVDGAFQAVFVFTAANLQVDSIATPRVHCIPEAQLRPHLLANKPDHELGHEAVEEIAQCLLKIAA
jgi:hypothetical protein